MDIKEYINRVIYTKKKIFLKIEMNKSINQEDLYQLCNINISKQRLIIAWSLIIDLLNDEYKDDINTLITPKILNFLINNEICLCDLGHLKLKNEYLKMIYEKDNSCWESLKNINTENNK